MLIELWERLRGYDKWTETEATIQSSELVDRLVEARKTRGIWRLLLSHPWSAWQSNCSIGWTDTAGAPHVAKFAAAENSALFQKYEGQWVSIRYNPADPGEYYLRELFLQRVFLAFLRMAILFWLALCFSGFAFSLFRTLERIHRP
ncbi:MAG TPA: DUF3592 domain-containing protein [Terracidiphilus sp.]|nr:DUF3592 domain-containing protein [Terracidiphilus sp.]